MKYQPNKQNESGNVLFLILIAVALFAALSYAVTQSTRSGSGTTERETVLLNSASLTQYPTALRTAVVRMILAGLDVGEVGFDSPSHPDFADGSSNQRVFHPNGGGAVYQDAPPEVMAANQSPVWRYNENFHVPQIGQDGAGGNDVVAFLPGVTVGVCRRLNEELGIEQIGDMATDYTDVPEVDLDNTLLAETFELGDVFETGVTDPISNVSGADDAFEGQPAGCFFDPNWSGATGGFIFYSVLLER